MEGLGLTKKLGILCAVFMITGAGLNFAPRPKQVERTEKEVAEMLPLKVQHFDAELAKGEYCSYKMDQSNYDILKPFGIVARTFSDGPEKYDVVVIASRSKESFHDPQVCLKAQGWALSNQREDKIVTKSRGEVPITLFDMELKDQKLTAMYFLKTTQGYYADMSKLKWDMFKYKMKNIGKDDEGSFVRIMPMGPSNVDKMKKFAAEWLDTAVGTSKNYY